MWPGCPAGTGKEDGDRHPKISDNVLIGASARILGNIRIGTSAQVGARNEWEGRRLPHCSSSWLPHLTTFAWADPGFTPPPAPSPSQVAAGSTVLREVPPRTLVAGSPAREIGTITGNPAQNMEQWSVSNKELLKSNLENDPFATTTASSSSSGSSGSGKAARQGGGGGEAQAPSSSGTAGQQGGAAAAAAAEAEAAPPQRPRDPTPAAKAAAQHKSDPDAASSEREARRKWGDNLTPPEFII